MNEEKHSQEYVSLKEYFNGKIGDTEKLFNSKFEAAERAIKKFEADNEKWKENANEWRGAMDNKDKTFATKNESERNTQDIKNLQLSEATLAGKASQNSVIIAYLLALISLAISVISIMK